MLNSSPQGLDFEQIKEIIPQRFPFLMLDRVIELEPGIRAVGVKNLTGNEWFYQGHFPSTAITPGAMMIEAIAQTAIVLFHTSKPKSKSSTYLLGKVEARFLKPVWPGDQLHIEVVAVKVASNSAIINGKLTVSGDLRAKGELMLAVKDRESL